MTVVRLVPLPVRLTLVACDGCGTEFEDMDAALDADGTSRLGCPNGCRRLTTPVYDVDGKTRLAHASARKDGPPR